MTNQLRPTTINGIRSLGRQISRDREIPRHQGLNLAAQQAGYESYAHAQRHFTQSDQPRMQSIRPLAPRLVNSSMNEFHQRALDRWGEALLAVNPNLSQSLEWSSPIEIAEIINQFVGGEMNHCHFPTLGGFDIEAVESSIEHRCLELVLGHSTRHLLKPNRLILEYIEDAPGESILVLETGTLRAKEVDNTYVDEPGHFHNRRQEIIRVDDGHYPRAHWDEDFIGYEEDGQKIELPDSAHILVRWERGKFIFVSKGSLWNGPIGPYDGSHIELSSSQIREIIADSVTQLLEA